jgi:hypothetical protein
MQLVKFLVITIATLIVRSVLNKAHLIITAAFAAVCYYLYPQVEAIYVAAAITTGINLIINAIHMAWEAYWLFTTAIKAEKLYAEASKLDPRVSWTTESWTQAEEALTSCMAGCTNCKTTSCSRVSWRSSRFNKITLTTLAASVHSHGLTTVR